MNSIECKVKICPFCGLQCAMEDTHCPSDGNLLSDPDARIDTVLDGRYRIDSLLGAGGFGLIYQAHHIALNKPCAIKILRMATLNETSRLKLEAQTMSSINHPNIAKVFSFGVTEERPYVAMELLSGRSLATLMDSGKLREFPLGKLVEQMCLGLDCAHKNGILHRDLKPSNIMIEGTADAPVVKLIDFGLAKRFESGATSQRLTQTGEVIGTARYMSPEQLTNSSLLTPASDIYSLGVIIEEMCLSVESSHPRLKSVAEKCMREEPADRFETAEDLLDFLRSKDRTASIRVAMFVAIVLAFVAGVGLMWNQHNQSVSDQSTTRWLEKGTLLSRLAVAESRELVLDLARSIDSRDAKSSDQKAKSSDTVEIVKRFCEINDPDDAIQWGKRFLTSTSDPSGVSAENRLLVFCMVSRCLLFAHRNAEVLTLFESVVPYINHSVKPRIRFDAYTSQMGALLRQRREKEAEIAYRQARSLCTAMRQVCELDYQRMHFTVDQPLKLRRAGEGMAFAGKNGFLKLCDQYRLAIGDLFFYWQRDYASALGAYESSKVRTLDLTPENRENFEKKIDYCKCMITSRELYRLRKFTEAIACQKKALALFENERKAAWLGQCLVECATCHLVLGQYRDAITVFEQVGPFREGLQYPVDSDAAARGTAECLFRLGQTDRAIALLQAATAEETKVFGEWAPVRAVNFQRLACLYATKHDVKKFQDSVQSAVTICEKSGAYSAAEKETLTQTICNLKSLMGDRADELERRAKGLKIATRL